MAGRNPLFGVFVGYHLRDGADVDMFGLPTEWCEPDSAAAMFDRLAKKAGAAKAS